MSVFTTWEERANPTVGLSAHPGQVDIRLTVKAQDEKAAGSVLDQVEAEVRARLGEAVFGTDETTLAQAALAAVARRGWRLLTLESGTEGRLLAQLGNGNPAFHSGQLLPATFDEGGIRRRAAPCPICPACRGPGLVIASASCH